MSKRVNWSRVISGVAKLVTGSSSDRRTFVEKLLKSNKSKATNTMIYYYVWMYRNFYAIKRKPQSNTHKLFSPSIERRLLAIDKKVSRKRKSAS